MTALAPFYLPEPNGGFTATAWTRGPWSLEAQHGGPPSALLARAMDAALGVEAAGWVPARTFVELLRPVPIARLRTEAEVVSQGRTVARLRARLLHGDTLIAQARALLIRAIAPEPHLERDDTAGLPDPESWPPIELDFFLDPVGYHRAMELRTLDGWPQPQARVWSRMRVPLVEGEVPSGWSRALCFADAAHGVAPALDIADATLINPDLELTLTRRPVGAWIGMAVQTRTEAHGVGLTRSLVYDERGPVGAASATLVVRPRG